MSEIKLKPCPFCGSEDVVIVKPINLGKIGKALLCNKCNTRVGFPMAYDDLMAMDAWNRRATNE